MLVHAAGRYATHMFEKSDLVPAEAASIGHVADGPASTDTSSRSLSRQDSRLTAMMDDQPDEDYWYDLRVCCWLSPVSTDCLGMPQNASRVCGDSYLHNSHLLRPAFTLPTQKLQQGSCDGLCKLILCLSPAPLFYQADYQADCSAY